MNIVVCKGIVGFIPTFVIVDVCGFFFSRFWNICLCSNLGTLGWESNNLTLTSIPMNSLCIHHILLLLLLVSNWVGCNDWVFESCQIGDKKKMLL